MWNDGYPFGGNYWSGYTGMDANGDGIGEMPYSLDDNNQDNYPLIAPLTVFSAGMWNGISYDVAIISNSTLSDFFFNPDEGAFIKFNVTGEGGSEGFCRVTISKSLLWVEDGWTIHVDGEPITDYTVIPDENYTYLYFIYQHSTKTVQITGTHVIPEFPSTMILPLFMVLTLLAVVFAKKKLPRKSKP